MKKSHPFIKTSRKGLTLIEVMLGMVIISITAVLAIASLFYPRKLVVNSIHEQSGIHAGVADIERHLYDPANLPEAGNFRTDGSLLIPGTDIQTTVGGVTNLYSGDEYSYLIITNTVTYRDGKTVELVTFRSLEVIKTLR